MAATERAQEYITAARTLNRAVWDGIHGLLTLQAEWNAGNYGSTLPAGTGSNAGVAAADVGAVVFDAADDLKTVLNAGIAGNMQKLL